MREQNCFMVENRKLKFVVFHHFLTKPVFGKTLFYERKSSSDGRKTELQF